MLKWGNVAETERLNVSLQEATLALLCFDEKHGALVAAQVSPEHFDGLYRDVAVGVLGYRKRYSKPPGHTHLEHLLDRLPGKPNVQAVRRMFDALTGQAESLNAEYIAGRAGEFVRRQALKAALFEATDRYMQNDEGLVDDIEQILAKVLRQRQETMDAGTFFNDTSRVFRFLDRRAEFYSLGIGPLDELGIGMVPKELLLYIATKSSGKSWFGVHAGRQGLMQRKKVVHVTLEMSADQVAGRYLQNWFSVARNSKEILCSVLEFDELERLTGFRSRRFKPKLDFGNPQIRELLRKKMKPWGTRLGNLVIREFPSGSLTIQMLTGYLDYLELAHKFVPQILIVDYPDLAKLDRDNYRHALGQFYVDLRGIATRRNLAVVAPTQSNRSGLTAKKVSSGMVSEDVTKVNTADVVLTYSRTVAEKRLNLARLQIAHARNAEDGHIILLSQSYATGQYVMQATVMQNVYWELMKEKTGVDPSEEE